MRRHYVLPISPGATCQARLGRKSGRLHGHPGAVLRAKWSQAIKLKLGAGKKPPLLSGPAVYFSYDRAN